MNANIICDLMKLLAMPKNIKSCMGLIHSWIQAKASILVSRGTKGAPWWDNSPLHASTCRKHSTASTHPSSHIWFWDKALGNSLAFFTLWKQTVFGLRPFGKASTCQQTKRTVKAITTQGWTKLTRAVTVKAPLQSAEIGWKARIWIKPTGSNPVLQSTCDLVRWRG